MRDESIAEDRLLAYLAAVFGFFALLLAAMRLFAILSSYVAGRTSEIGVRMALGANPARICGLVLRQVGAVMSVGIGAGAGLALATGSVLASATYGVSPGNPLVLAASAGLLVLTGLAAALLPAKRAAAIRPLVALRQD
jgi:ABC-type antimicrobial peptide transport system permease subunit